MVSDGLQTFPQRFFLIGNRAQKGGDFAAAVFRRLFALFHAQAGEGAPFVADGGHLFGGRLKARFAADFGGLLISGQRAFYLVDGQQFVTQVVTQTDMFRTAIAGAPVGNMTSAYSGIRWGSGVARQFQYEKGQSRLSGSLWEARDEYIDNSPVFFADRNPCSDASAS